MEETEEVGPVREGAVAENDGRGERLPPQVPSLHCAEKEMREGLPHRKFKLRT